MGEVVMNFAAPLGPGAVARSQACQPGEPLLWATYRRVFYYDIEGLDTMGAPERGVLSRGARAVGRGIGDFVLTGVGEVLFAGGDETGNGKPPSADHLVFGPGSDCLAHRASSHLDSGPGKYAHHLWLMTPARLAVYGRRPMLVEKPVAREDRSLFSKTLGFGKEMIDVGRDIAKIVADNRRKYGDNVENEPIAVPDLTLRFEFPRDWIASVVAFERKGKPCLRVSFVDSSGVDFVFDDADSVQRAVDLTNGMR